MSAVFTGGGGELTRYGPQAFLNPKEPWPEGVEARAWNLAYANVDTRFQTPLDDHQQEAVTTCDGCGTSSTFCHGSVTGCWCCKVSSEERPWKARKAALYEAKQWAQAHAERCRFVAKPG